MRWKIAIAIGLLVAILPLAVGSQTHVKLAHKDHNADTNKTKTPEPELDEDGFEIISSGPSEEQLQRINQLYLQNVKPIFKQKCLNCHGVVDKLPWYAKVPGPKQLIQKDIREAKEHMDMSDDFPFAGHGTAKDDLEALEEVLEDDSMPPFQYLIMHWKSSLTKNDKKEIRSWIEKSKAILTNEGENHE